MEKEFLKAVKSGNTQKVAEMLQQDRSLIGVRDLDSSTPLHWAAWKGHAEIVQILLDAGADMQAKNENGHWGNTPLHAAAHGNQAAAARVLIASGADVNAKDSFGQTPLAHTAIHKATAAAKALKEAGAAE
jgi:ankyrin repeat protein